MGFQELLERDGAATVRQYTYADITPGMAESFTVRVTKEMMCGFLEITGDHNPLHNDEAYAQEKGFSGKAAYGMLTASFLSTLAGVYLPGKYSLIHSVQVEFPKPVFIGDQLTISGVVSTKDDRFQIITLKIAIRNQAGQKVCRGKMQIGVLE